MRAGPPARTARTVAAVVLLWLTPAMARAQVLAQPATTPPPAASTPVETRGYGLRPDPEPPRYVRPATRSGLPGLEGATWLDVGLEFRARVEHRDGDYRRSIDRVDDALLVRSRLYLGVRDVLGPLRLGLEVQDSRRNVGPFTRDDRDVNVLEPIQGFAELHWRDGAGRGRPVSVKAGRQAFEYLDRRLLARNEWRNTTNTFDGVRATVGSTTSPWQVTGLALAPVQRRVSRVDRTDRAQRLAGVIGEWRGWRSLGVLQPYYLHLSQNGARAASGTDRSIHSLAVHGFGPIGRTRWDWDVDVVWQWGRDAGRVHRAAALGVETGYSPRARWQPRLSVNQTHATGDASPTDTRSERFERLFGFARPFSASDYIQWENVRATKGRIEITPTAALRIDAGLSGYWLAHAADRWNVAGLRDPSGRSGTHIGHEIDVRVRVPLGARVSLNVGYARFWPGAFARATSGRATPSQLPYVEFTFNTLR